MLKGIKVLDLAGAKAGFCTGLLARLGARVIKVEPPGGVVPRGGKSFPRDASRRISDPAFQYNNANKLGITLNLESKAGREVFLKLARWADVVVETLSPAAAKRLDLGHKVLSKANPRLVHISVTGFGRKGPHSRYLSCNLVAAACGGAMHVSGSPETPPLKPGGEQSYGAGALFAVLAILLALQKRRKTGLGAYLDLSLQEAVTATLEQVLPRYFHDRTVPARSGSRRWDDAFCILPCRDGFMQMTLFHQWETLVELLQSEGAAEDLAEEPWEDEGRRRANAGHIVEVLAGWMKNHTKDELFKWGQLMGFPWAPVQSPGEVLQSAQLAARGFFTPLEAGRKTLFFPGLPFRFDDPELPPLQRAPAPGAHNLLIYRDELGFSEAEIEELAAAGVI